MTLSIIILNYNASHVLKDCLKSLDNYGVWLHKNCELFVVDNASKDDSVSMIRANFPWVKLIENNDNLGFSKGNNVAIRQATGDYQLLLNPDTVVLPDTLQKCLDFLKNNQECGVVTCRVEFPDGRLDLDCHRGFPTPWASLTHFVGLSKLFPKSKLFGQYQLSFEDLTTSHEIDSAVGAFMMMPKKALDEVGLLDEQFFFYGEDIDWCFRFKKAGFKVYYYPECKIIHYKGYSSGIRKETQNVTTATTETKRRIALESVRAMRLFYDKHYKNTYPFFITWFVYGGMFLLKQKRLMGK